MAKPAITKRAVKAAALTYSELDTNFQNLADATITITGGTTAVTADLNGNITLVAGTNVTITGNNTAKTITINSTGTGGGWVGTAASNLDMQNFSIFSSTGNIQAGDDINFPSGSGPFVPGGGELLCRGGSINLQTGTMKFSSATLGTPSNTTTPVAWMQVTVNGSTRFIPLYS